MSPVVAVIAPGAMGAAVGKRLGDNGLRCSPRSMAAAKKPTPAPKRPAWRQPRQGRRAGRLILPCCRLAMRCRWRALCSGASRGNAKPVYVDPNAINPKTIDHEWQRSPRPNALQFNCPNLGQATKSLEMLGRASMRLAPRRRNSPRYANMASVYASLTAK